MNLCEVIEGLDIVRVTGPADPAIATIAYDSRKVTSGALFFAFPGEKLDGFQFVNNAIHSGATAVASPRPRPEEIPSHISWVQLVEKKERRALARAAANFYRHPANSLKLIGVTGTNGKTTTTFLVDSILQAAGCTTGLVGTTGYRTPQASRSGANTTPESLDLQQIFAEVRDAGGTHVVLETSSHALAMDRLFGCHFAVALFTNLTRDHLDYHKTFEEYFAAKRLLFEGTGAGAPDTSVINSDDSYATRLEGLAARTLTYGLKNTPDITTKKFAPSFGGLEFTAQTPAGNIEVRSPMVGRINVYNILAAIGAGIALQIPNDKIEQGIANLELVPGRFQRIDEGQPFLVVVDYAHTDDALRNLTALAREFVAQHGGKGRVITVFGCGGDRDRAKRPLMAVAAAEGSDFVVMTSDNPRSERPLAIIRDALPGLQRLSTRFAVEPDRRAAIALALHEARPGDIVLIAGKGHEKVQILPTGPVPFDDVQVARDALRVLGYGLKKGPAVASGATYRE